MSEEVKTEVPEEPSQITKSSDKLDIESEEREQMLNAENKAHDVEKKTVEVENKSDKKEGMEVKPKKIPIGGIQMPGFFTRSKSKERCKEDSDAIEESGLIEKDKEQKGEKESLPQKIKLPNPFRKSKLVNESETGGDKQAGEAPKRRLLPPIRLPVFPLRKKAAPEGGMEPQAGLASMETLDDKSQDENKDGAEMKTIDLEKEPEQGDASEEGGQWRKWFIEHKFPIGALVIFLILLLIIIIAVTWPSSRPSYIVPIKNGKYVETITGCGNVEGLLEDSAVAFRGIPYARSPVGDLRFRSAQPLNDVKFCWNGTLKTHNATPPCMQLLPNGTLTGVEDCLTLDVVTPYVRYDSPLPVVVLVGAEGGLVGGSPGRMRPSARYARSRDVVFVRPNFRMGVLGFLALDVLSKSVYPETSGNYGLSDLVEALHWVQLNIEHFGGDPHSVTVWGHQAGATLVTALATMKNAKDYFARAWASSPSAIYPSKERQEAEIANRPFLSAVQCSDADCLRSLPAEKLVNAADDTWRKAPLDLPARDEIPSKRHEWLVLDGVLLREHPAEVWAREQGLPVNLVLGTTAHAASSSKLLEKHLVWTEALVKEHVSSSLLGERNLSSAALALYPPTYQGLAAMITDVRVACPLLAIASQMRQVPFYVVTMQRGEQQVADIASDVDAILGRYEPKTPEQRRYFSAIQSLFYHYVWHGKVEEDMKGYHKVLEIGQDVLPNATYSHCKFWINNDIVLPYAALD